MTSIEWLIEQMEINNYISKNAHWLVDEAKELEKQQIIDAKKQLLKDISSVLLSEENLKKCDRISDRDVIEAVGQTIVNFQIN